MMIVNYEREELKISIPLIDDIELQRIDTFYNDIVSEYTKSFVKEKEQVIVQRLMMNLQQENQELKEHIEKYEHYCKTTGIEELMKENKKYKEVFEKALDFIDCHFKEMVADEEAQELLDILKEVK